MHNGTLKCLRTKNGHALWANMDARSPSHTSISRIRLGGVRTALAPELAVSCAGLCGICAREALMLRELMLRERVTASLTPRRFGGA